MNNKENILNFKAQNISKTQFIENEIVQNEIMRLVLHAGRDLGSACWEIVMGYIYRMIWFLQLPAKDLSGNTMAFSSITSEGT